MFKRSRTLRAVQAELNGARQRVMKLSGPADAIAMVPFLLGFTPTESLVVIVLEGPRKRFGPCFRLDVASDPVDVTDEASYVVTLVRRHRFSCVMLFAFSSSEEPAKTVLSTAHRKLVDGGVEVVDAIRADGSRWRSLLCTNPSCCSPTGNPYDVDASPAAAEAVLAGMQRAPDRDSLRASVAACDETRRAAVAAAARRVRRPLDAATLIDNHLDAPDRLTVNDIAALAVAVQPTSSRDAAWAMMTRETARSHFDLWRAVMRSVPDELLSPVGSLAAFAAWLTGSGVLASHAAERVLAVDPTYTMAQLVLSALQSAVHPDTWTALALPAPQRQDRR